MIAVMGGDHCEPRAEAPVARAGEEARPLLVVGYLTPNPSEWTACRPI